MSDWPCLPGLLYGLTRRPVPWSITDAWHRHVGGGLGRPDFCCPGSHGSDSSRHGGAGGVTHCDHDRVPGGREDICVIVALVVLGELLGEEFTGELEAEGEGG